jgi:hypothetical protein
MPRGTRRKKSARMDMDPLPKGLAGFCQIVAAQICTIKRKVVTFGVLHPFGLMVHIV